MSKSSSSPLWAAREKREKQAKNSKLISSWARMAVLWSHILSFRRGCASSAWPWSFETRPGWPAYSALSRMRFAPGLVRLDCYLFGSLLAGPAVAPRWTWCAPASTCSYDIRLYHSHLEVTKLKYMALIISPNRSLRTCLAYHHLTWNRRRLIPDNVICTALDHPAVRIVRLSIVDDRRNRTRSRPGGRPGLGPFVSSPLTKCLVNISHTWLQKFCGEKIDITFPQYSSFSGN